MKKGNLNVTITVNLKFEEFRELMIMPVWKKFSEDVLNMECEKKKKEKN
jgi:hypothetical protein